MLQAKTAAPLGERRWPQQFAVRELTAGVHRTIVMPAGCFVEARLAADLELSGRTVTWVRPAKYELAAGAWEQPQSDGTVVVQPAAGSRLPVLGGPLTGSVLTLVCRGSEGLRASVADTGEAAEQLGSPFPPDTLDRLVAVADGRASVIDSVLRASCDRTWRSLAEAAHRAQDVYGLLAEVSLQLLAVGGRDRTDALLLAAHLGYAHPRLRALAPALDDPAREPWWQPLTGGWYRMHPLWGTALLALPASGTCDFQARLARLVGELEGERADREAVELCRRLGACELQAELLAESGCALAAAGEQELVRSWLTALPDRLLRQRGLGRLSAELRARIGPSRGPGQENAEPWTEAWAEACAALAEGRADAALAGARRARLLARRSSAPPSAAERAGLLARRARRLLRTRSMSRRMRLLLQATESVDFQVARPETEERTECEALVGQAYPVPAPVGVPAFVRAADAVDLEARLLGAFRAELAGREVAEWSGNLGRSLFKYLLLHRCRPVPRELLAEVFWPGVPAGSARNRLNVALYNLRHDLRKVSSRTVVVHLRESYCLAPDLTVRLDTEEFVRRASAAGRSRARREQDRAESVRCHEAAAALYTGDLLEDTPYTDWAVPERERLAAIHLDLLEGLAGLYLEDGAYPPCVETCRRLLARDPCREEAHRLLMRAFVRQNQPHRAAAQFDTLRRELDGTLGMTPDPETRRLYESVRRHRAV